MIPIFFLSFRLIPNIYIYIIYIIYIYIIYIYIFGINLRERKKEDWNHEEKKENLNHIYIGRTFSYA